MRLDEQLPVVDVVARDGVAADAAARECAPTHLRVLVEPIAVDDDDLARIHLLEVRALRSAVQPEEELLAGLLGDRPPGGECAAQAQSLYAAPQRVEQPVRLPRDSRRTL